jgi:hypothetical protein
MITAKNTPIPENYISSFPFSIDNSTFSKIPFRPFAANCRSERSEEPLQLSQRLSPALQRAQRGASVAVAQGIMVECVTSVNKQHGYADQHSHVR